MEHIVLCITANQRDMFMIVFTTTLANVIKVTYAFRGNYGCFLGNNAFIQFSSISLRNQSVSRKLGFFFSNESGVFLAKEC